jgi:hypothetical protein
LLLLLLFADRFRDKNDGCRAGKKQQGSYQKVAEELL